MSRIFKNVIGYEINVHGKSLEVEGLLRTDNIDQEIKNLLREGYLREVNPTKTKGTLK